MAYVLSILIVVVAVATAPISVTVVEYRPVKLIRAVDYAAVCYALTVAQEGGSFTGALSDFLSKAYREPPGYTVVEYELKSDLKKAVIEFDHGWVKIRVEVYLRLRVKSTLVDYSSGRPETVYVVEVSSDRPVALSWAGGAERINATCWRVKPPIRAIDSRGLEASKG
ncbi:MAG: hypothetical protein DRN04_13820 [Thermoprotei archaeon]|nr:MAG: hypothetical protein DRN04_13820 [Thermoprotei archaeon]